MFKNVPNSGDVTKSELDLFKIPPTNTSIDDGFWCLYYPLAGVEGGPIEFTVPATETEYIHMARSYLYLVVDLSLPVKPKESSEITQYEKDIKQIAPINNLASSLFTHVDVLLKGFSF
jgi:hypothetical protein